MSVPQRGCFAEFRGSNGLARGFRQFRQYAGRGSKQNARAGAGAGPCRWCTIAPSLHIGDTGVAVRLSRRRIRASRGIVLSGTLRTWFRLWRAVQGGGNPCRNLLPVRYSARSAAPFVAGMGGRFKTCRVGAFHGWYPHCAHVARPVLPRGRIVIAPVFHDPDHPGRLLVLVAAVQRLRSGSQMGGPGLTVASRRCVRPGWLPRTRLCGRVPCGSTDLQPKEPR